MQASRVQVFVDDDAIPAGLEAALRRIGARVSFAAIGRTRPSTQTDAAIILTSSEHDHHDAERIESLLRGAAAIGCPTLVVNRRPEALEPIDGPFAITSDLNEDEYAGHLKAMIALRPTLRASKRPSSERPLARLTHQAADHIAATNALKAALPMTPLPNCPGLTFKRVARSLEEVGGDFHAVRRLDQEHVGILIADAEGHGVPASILTMFVERVLRVSELDARGRTRLLAPGDVLERLNVELIATPLCESGFVAATYAIIHMGTGEVRFARGGAPYPLHRTSDGELRPLTEGGLLIGVDEDAAYSTQTALLGPGDSLVLHTDGLGAIEADAVRTRAGDLDATTATPSNGRFLSTLRLRGPTAALELAADRYDTLRRIGAACDDCTILAITRTAE